MAFGKTKKVPVTLALFLVVLTLFLSPSRSYLSPSRKRGAIKSLGSRIKCGKDKGRRARKTKRVVTGRQRGWLREDKEGGYGKTKRVVMGRQKEGCGND
ncbi:MAG: hypothetical protein BGO28_05765 [Alphaproteobacteria bacterium 43-37]|nr:MAG: hypothetical protein BGO28_05765 [Alphaproteobacteria bacterium 43-37]